MARLAAVRARIGASRARSVAWVGGDLDAVAGEVDRRCDHLGERQPAEPGVHVQVAGQDARHGHRARPAVEALVGRARRRR